MYSMQFMIKIMSGLDKIYDKVKIVRIGRYKI